jgi:hypothetical protein
MRISQHRFFGDFGSRPKSRRRGNYTPDHPVLFIYLFVPLLFSILSPKFVRCVLILTAMQRGVTGDVWMTVVTNYKLDPHPSEYNRH